MLFGLIILVVDCLMGLLQGCDLPVSSSTNTCQSCMCGKANLMLRKGISSKAFLGGHCLEMCVFLLNLMKLRETLLKSHLHLSVFISISLLYILYSNNYKLYLLC